MAFYRCERCGVYSKSEDDDKDTLKAALIVARNYTRQYRVNPYQVFGFPGDPPDNNPFEWVHTVHVSFLYDHHNHLDQITIQEHDYANGAVLL